MVQDNTKETHLINLAKFLVRQVPDVTLFVKEFLFWADSMHAGEAEIWLDREGIHFEHDGESWQETDLENICMLPVAAPSSDSGET